MALTERYEIRLASGPEEVEEAQRLRKRVFYDQKGIAPPKEVLETGLDRDRFDPYCEHLIAIDRSRRRVVANYRMLRQDIALAPGGPRFYAEAEFDVSRLLEAKPRGLLEVGRACIHPDYQGGSSLMLLMFGEISAYAEEHGFTDLFGCASFLGTDPDVYANEFGKLQQYLAPEHLRVRALPDRYVPLVRPATQTPQAPGLWGATPPLVRIYLRLNASVGDGAVIDREMGTIDVFLRVSINEAPPEYQAHYLGKN